MNEKSRIWGVAMQNSKKDISLDDVITLCVGKNSFYYKSKWENKKLGHIYCSWNWAGFFLGITWMVYRKMYFESLILVLVYTFLAVLQTNHITYFYLSELVNLFIAITGNSIYQKKINRNINKSMNFKQTDRMKYLRNCGGVNIIIAILWQLVYGAIYYSLY